MTAEQWSRVKALVGQALSMPDIERAAFLDDACQGDAALRREVDELLAGDDPDSFLEHSPVADGAMSLTAGDRLGPYEILGLLGAGGMGEVYKATDTRLDRTVAIKVLPAGRLGPRSEAAVRTRGEDHLEPEPPAHLHAP